jgi:hypothetical protein
VAFLKNRISVSIVSGILVLAAIGIIGSLIANPAGFIQRIAVIILIGLAVYFIARRFFFKSSPERKEQRAFLKAAKNSKKRLNQKSGEAVKRSTLGSLTSLKKTGKSKKKSPVHLTVIEGKKSKKKNRASF